LRGPVGALPRNPKVQCGFEKIPGLGGVVCGLKYDMSTMHCLAIFESDQFALLTVDGLTT
jgi:hypothetical protein